MQSSRRLAVSFINKPGSFVGSKKEVNQRTYVTSPPKQKTEPSGPFLFSRKSWERGSYTEEGWEIALMSVVIPTGLYFAYDFYRGYVNKEETTIEWADQELEARRDLWGSERRVNVEID